MILKTESLSVGYENKILYTNLNLELRKGSVTAMLGVNGVGKSTLIKCLCGFIPSLEGDVLIDGKSIKEYSKHQLASFVAVVLTDREINGGLTVEELVAMGRYPYTNFFGKLTDNDKNIVYGAMKDVGITALKDRFIAELSDGERQKVMIAKSIAQESKIIVLDEPTSFLDIQSRIEVLILLRRLAKTRGVAFLLSLHDLDLSLQYSDYLWIVNKSDGVLCGATEDMILGGYIDKAMGDGISFDIDKGVFVMNNSNGVAIRYEGTDLLWLKNCLRKEGYYIDNNKGSITITARSYTDIDVDGVACTSIKEVMRAIKNPYDI